ncbi:GumC family protein [Roseovarius sp. B08]|uniref:GumC family protein n=1 Tax=Roseovarius sp. B08 TaxID=3449223 RepID=UPI003EDB7E0C
MKPTPHTRSWRDTALEAGTSRLQQPFQSIDLMGMYSVLERNLRLILAIVVSFTVLGYIYLQSLPPEYSARASIILDTREEQITPAQEVISNLNVTSAVLAGEIITIRSNVLIGRVVDRLDLTNHPEFDPRLPRWPGLWPFTKRLVTGSEPSHEVAQRLPDSVLRSWVVDALRQRIAVEQVGVSYVIAIRVDSVDPELAAEIANATTEEYIESLLDTKAVATQRVNSWLAERLNELSVQVEGSRRRGRGFQGRDDRCSRGQRREHQSTACRAEHQVGREYHGKSGFGNSPAPGRKSIGGRWLGRSGPCPDLTVA